MKKSGYLEKAGETLLALEICSDWEFSYQLKKNDKEKCSLGTTGKRLCKTDGNITDHIIWWKCIKWTWIFRSNQGINQN